MDSVFESIFRNVTAFIFRCKNDKDYTMEYLSGAIQAITGYADTDILQNARASYVGLTYEEDRDRVFGEVDAAIEAGKAWDTTYRLVHKSGHLVWVRERGNAVFVDGEMVYLQGLVVEAGAEFELRERLEERVGGTQRASETIVDLTQQITSSVKELSMLSVNARIEAARSGEAGKGFAVVAHEIKTLADRNAALAKKIAGQVEVMNNAPR